MAAPIDPGGSTAHRQGPDGSWQPAQPLGWQGSGPDFEVYSKRRPMEWVAYDEDVCVATGTARTKAGLYFAIWRARRRLTRGR
jgi:hypothetical protein